jgi:hypothetical protein
VRAPLPSAKSLELSEGLGTTGLQCKPSSPQQARTGPAEPGGYPDIQEWLRLSKWNLRWRGDLELIRSWVSLILQACDQARNFSFNTKPRDSVTFPRQEGFESILTSRLARFLFWEPHTLRDSVVVGPLR